MELYAKTVNRKKLLTIAGRRSIVDVWQGPKCATVLCNKQLGNLSILTSMYRVYPGFPANIYLFKVNNRDTIKRNEISSKLKIRPAERRWCFYF